MATSEMNNEVRYILEYPNEAHTCDLFTFIFAEDNIYIIESYDTFSLSFCEKQFVRHDFV